MGRGPPRMGLLIAEPDEEARGPGVPGPWHRAGPAGELAGRQGRRVLVAAHGAGDEPDRLLALGERLRPLRDQGVLVVGSGHMTHGLPFLTREMFLENRVPGWSADFDAWAADALARGDLAELARFRTAAPGMPYAHPTVEHFTPLFITLGAAADATAAVTTTIDGYAIGLSKRSFQTT